MQVGNVIYLSPELEQEDEDSREVREKSGPVKSLPRSEFARIAREHAKAEEDKARLEKSRERF